MYMIPFSLGPTQQAKVRAAMNKGASVKLRFSAASIGGKGPNVKHLACTPTQAKKLQNKKAKGLGCELTFSAKSLKATAKHGSGLGSWLVKAIRALGAKGVRGAAKFAGNKLKQKYPGWAGDIASAGLDQMGDYIGKKVQGGKMIRKRIGLAVPKNKMQSAVYDVNNSRHQDLVEGGSAFTDFFTKTIPRTFSKPSSALGVLGSMASFIPVVGSVAGPALGAASTIAKMTGNGVKKRKKAVKRKTKTGLGIVAPGMQARAGRGFLPAGY